MGRKGRIWSAVLIAAAGCTTVQVASEGETADVRIEVICSDMESKAAEPDENRLTDLTLMIFEANGFLEERKVFNRKELASDTGIIYETMLLKDKEYSIYACANIGVDINASTIEELEGLRCHLAYPDEYREGLPMAGQIEGFRLEDGVSVIEVPLKRMMAKISLRIDRGGLSDDVEMNVVSARIGNCPKHSLLFRSNSVSSHDDCFSTGFTRSEAECMILNRNTGQGISGELSFYMLENMQGEFSSAPIDKDADKVFDKLDTRQETCSFIELKMDYESDRFQSISSPLTYRFYLGGGRNNLDIERNCHYRITVIPEDDGLSDEGWRIDKSGLESKTDDIYFEMTPSGFIQAEVGDILNIRCSFQPSSAPFDIGLEELEHDKERGIYDYVPDEDGHGVTLTMKAPGTGIVYMTAGEPVNEAGMLVIEVNNIKNKTL